MRSDKEYVIRLNEDDLGQLIDGIEVRHKDWLNTAIYEETGEIRYPDYSLEQCRDADEAWNIADHYQRILTTIVEQRERQK